MKNRKMTKPNLEQITPKDVIEKKINHIKKIKRIRVKTEIKKK
jgi:hypothetical protein